MPSSAKHFIKSVLVIACFLAAESSWAKPIRLLSYELRELKDSIEIQLEFNGRAEVKSGKLAPSPEKPRYRIYFDLEGRFKKRPKFRANMPWLEKLRVGIQKGERFRIVADSRDAEINVGVKRVGNTIILCLSKGAAIKDDSSDGSSPLIPAIKKKESDPDEPFPVILKESPSKIIEAAHYSSVVVLDPGHGGEETGAIGPRGTQEKEIVLQIAKRVRTRLLAWPGIRVFLTREYDKNVTLEGRVAFANGVGAQIFVSIHNNAHSSTRIGGIESYFLDNSTDRGTERVVERENQTAKEDFFSHFKGKQDLEFILTSLSLDRKISESKDLAGLIHLAIRDRVKEQKLPVPINGNAIKGNLFYVLWGVHCPSALLELGYISNPQDERLLLNDKFLSLLADAIASGIRKTIDLGRENVYNSALE